MEVPILLKTCNHEVFTSAVIAGKELCDSAQPSLLTATINFELGSFRLEGDWQFMMTANKHAQPEWSNCYSERITVDASIYPGLTIDLSDDENDGAVFILEGNIRDNDNLAACSGLLVLDKITEGCKQAAGKWNISFYIYDNGNEDCEIAFKIPVYVFPSDSRLN